MTAQASIPTPWLMPSHLRHIQPEWLVSFLAVADTGSFSAAAKRLHSSQPRISNHVAQLETLARSLLIDRRSRPVVLTPAGEVMTEHARIVLQALDDASAALAAQPGQTVNSAEAG